MRLSRRIEEARFFYAPITSVRTPFPNFLTSYHGLLPHVSSIAKLQKYSPIIAPSFRLLPYTCSISIIYTCGQSQKPDHHPTWSAPSKSTTAFLPFYIIWADVRMLFHTHQHFVGVVAERSSVLVDLEYGATLMMPVRYIALRSCIPTIGTIFL